MLDLVVVRVIFIFVLAASTALLRPFGLPTWQAGAAGLVLGGCIIFFEVRLERVSLKRLIGAAFGSVLGILGAFMMSLILDKAVPQQGFLHVVLLLWMMYVGMIVGAKKGDMLNLAALGGIFGGEKTSKKTFKILDTSVIIDGRIADIAETGFLDGVLVVPQFVLRELQLVADSADSMKRNRGRRGLDILQRIQKMAHLNVQIVEEARSMSASSSAVGGRRLRGPGVARRSSINRVEGAMVMPSASISSATARSRRSSWPAPARRMTLRARQSGRNSRKRRPRLMPPAITACRTPAALKMRMILPSWPT